MRLPAKVGLWLAYTAILLVAGAWIWNWYHPPKDRTIVRMVESPYRAPDAFQGLDLEKVVVPAPGGVQGLKTAPSERAKIEKKLGAPLPPDHLLSLKDIGPLPYGGTVALTLKPSTNEDGTAGPGEVVATVFPRRAPFFEWAPTRTFSLWGGVGGSSSGSTAGQMFGAEFRQDLFRTGMIRWDARAGAIHLVGQDTLWYAAVGAKVTF